MSGTEHTAPKPDVYERVTSQIVNAIEQGVGTWRMPWHTSGKFAFSPINVTTKKPYRGLNVVALWAVARIGIARNRYRHAVGTLYRHRRKTQVLSLRQQVAVPKRRRVPI